MPVMESHKTYVDFVRTGFGTVDDVTIANSVEKRPLRTASDRASLRLQGDVSVERTAAACTAARDAFLSATKRSWRPLPPPKAPSARAVALKGLLLGIAISMGYAVGVLAGAY